MFVADLLIGGDEIASSDGRTFVRFDPVSGKTASRASAATVEDAIAAADAADAAAPSWAAVGPSQRRALLNRAADLFEDKSSEFQARMMDELGFVAAVSRRNVQLAAATLREAAALTTRIAGKVIPSDKPGALSLAIRQPVGVVLGIAPWNAPVVLGVRAIAVPLACGNSVILKSSELCPATHQLIGAIFSEAGFPPGVVNVISNAPQDAARIVEALIAHPAVRRVNFTGSSRTGRVIAACAARHLKPALLELGGKSPLVVLDDADLDAAAAAASFGAFTNQGQICMSTERLIVDRPIADAFLEKFLARAASIRVGDPRDQASHLGALVNEEAGQRIAGLIDDALNKGAVLVHGAKASGCMMPPTILDRITPDMDIYHEETFGPVACIVRVDGVEEAIAAANDSEYGLSAAVFGRDLTRALVVAKKIKSGICHINSTTVQNEPQMPFGGVKASGYGRFGSSAEINEFTDLRWITISTAPESYPF